MKKLLFFPFFTIFSPVEVLIAFSFSFRVLNYTLFIGCYKSFCQRKGHDGGA